MPHIKATVPEVRKFGLMFGALTLAIAGFCAYKGSDIWMGFAGGSAFFLLAGLLAYPVLKPVYVGWMTFAYALGWFNTRLIMGISFYTVFTPIALAFRLLGKDALGLQIDKGAASYWVKRSPEPIEKKRYEQLF